MLQVVEDLASINQRPLHGLLTGKFHPTPPFIPMTRRIGIFKAGLQAQRLQELAALEPVLTRDGRNLTQAALGWLWGVNDTVFPSRLKRLPR